ncbi:MAG: uracil-DNA glycosylase [Actinomycetota bacterium]
MNAALGRIAAEVTECRACPRLVDWREKVARDKTARFADETYWARPVPGFGDPLARILVLGLAPAAHGGNRTGRIFTGDRSGDFLYGSLHRVGLANQPISVARDDGLSLRDCYVTAVVRCAPPANKPTPQERDRCLPFLQRELDALPRARVIVTLGAFGWDGALRALAARGAAMRPKPRFAHAAEVSVGTITMIGCFHPSQQNTFTGRLTEPMIDAIFRRARSVVDALDRTQSP